MNVVPEVVLREWAEHVCGASCDWSASRALPAHDDRRYVARYALELRRALQMSKALTAGAEAALTEAESRPVLKTEWQELTDRCALLEEKAEQMVTAIAGRPSESQIRAYPVLRQAEEFHRRAFNELRAALASKKGE